MSFTLEDQTVRGPAGDWVVLTASGGLNHETAWMLRDRLIGLLGEGHRCFGLDLEGVEFLDSTGSGVLVGGLVRTRRASSWLQLVCTRHSGAERAADHRAAEGVLPPSVGGPRG